MRVRDKDDRGVVQSVVLFLGVSVLSGALAAGLAIPFAGLAGFSTEKTAETLQDLPQELTTVPPSRLTKIYTSDRKLVATLYEQNRVPLTSLSQVNPIMQKAIVAIEDDRYFEHGALDAKGTLRALVRNQSNGEVQQGGSSITQQYVKLSLVEKANAIGDAEAIADATADTYERKIAELRYAIAVEKQFSKQEILLKYLNLANFGDGSYGVEAAARHYFNTTAAKLTLPQAAMLAGLVKNPTGYDPTNSPSRAKERRDTVLFRMRELNVISAKQYNDAKKTRVLNGPVKKVLNGCANSPYPFYCEYVVSKLMDNPAFGKTDKAREHYIKTAGITVITSLDSKMQAAAQKSIDQHSKPNDDAVAAITMVEPGTGLVKAMVQSRPYGSGKNQTAYNLNVEKSYKGGYGGFQNGSTMKALTVAAAIQKGFPLTYRIPSPSPLPLSKVKFQTCSGTTYAPEYNPKNSTKASAEPTMVEAAQKSTNTYFLQLSQRTGLCPIAKLATSMGMYNAQSGEPLEQVVSMTLGVDYVTPLMMANAYATFAARGNYCTPQIITSVQNYKGSQIVTPGPSCKQVLAPEVADGVSEVLHQVMEPGGTGSKLKFGKSDLAGKTGTIQDNEAVWYAGYSNKLATASVVADADLPYRNLINQTLDGRPMRDASGSGTAGPLWKTAMQGALAGLPTTKFTAPTDKTRRGDVKDLPFVNGMSPEEAANKLRGLGFEAEIVPGQVNSVETAGTVAYTTPRQADGAPEGSKVMIFVSNGSMGQTQPPPTSPGIPNPPNPPVPPNTGKPGGPITPGCPPWHPKYPNCGGR
ncbi:penicillin-binding protein [Kribbella sp. CA-293567]|uniref:penicillin-binding protein n=1 Tax=Kribbella sp. CA-293567 TaxID=3002436 RepID=UPI0022DE0B48|nr:penicillin-binding protein [Kribbella sp. CA-293567]WBQ04991.1 penicillin-binding protein [Kribbella sp. CA-293567]